MVGHAALATVELNLRRRGHAEFTMSGTCAACEYGTSQHLPDGWAAQGPSQSEPGCGTSRASAGITAQWGLNRGKPARCSARGRFGPR